MSSVIISGDTSGAVTVSAPAVAGTNTLTLQAATATSAVNTLATAVASTSGTSIDFTGLPSWVKKINVMFNGVSTNGTSNLQIQIGTGGTPKTSGYLGSADTWSTGVGTILFTTGFGLTRSIGAASVVNGNTCIITSGSNVWSSNSMFGQSDAALMHVGAGSVTLSGTLDMIRITTVSGTSTFDLGSINILYEG